MNPQGIFNRFLARRADGEELSIGDLVDEHPEYEDELRQLWRKQRTAERAIEDVLPAEPEEARDEASHKDHSSEVLRRLEQRRGSFGRYELRGDVGGGGQGIVYRAWDEELRRYIAMKVILGKGSAEDGADTPERNARAVSRFLEEAQVTGQLNHPGIVPLHELGIDDEGRVYFTMSLVKGRSLKTILPLAHEGRDGWSVTRALSVLQRVCETMAYAHDKGVVHRDLKPSNVLVGRYGAAYVIDWGLARVIGEPDTRDLRLEGEAPASVSFVETDRHGHTPTPPDSPLLTMDGDVVGTPSYMPPEQARGEAEKLGPRSDVYSVGAILYQLLTGRAPYTSPGAHISPLYIWRFVLDGAPTPLAKLGKDQPPELVAICEKAMARDASERFADMGEMAEELRAFLENRVVRSYRTGPIVEIRKWASRNMGTAVSLGSALIVAAIASFLLVWIERERAREVLEVSDPQRIAALIEESWKLGPIHPNYVAVREDWLRRAQSVARRVNGYRNRLDDLRRRAVAQEERHEHRNMAEMEDAARLDVRQIILRDRDQAIQKKIETIADVTAEPSRVARAERDLAILEEDTPHLEAEVEKLSTRVNRRGLAWQFTDEDEQALHERLNDTDIGLERLREEVDRVEDDLEDARTLVGLTIDDQCELWDRVIREVEESEVYGGMKLTVQIGLIPLGQDPESGLQEFWHVLSGDRPRRDESGRYAIGRDTGVVLVLIPAGELWIGAQKDDPAGHNFDPQASPWDLRLHDARLDSYFLSKYELTQGQWFRATGSNPSAWMAGSDWMGYGSVSWSHPVEGVSWMDCDRVLRRYGLLLPTEVQWERAARAGQDGAYVHGGVARSIVGQVNALEGDVHPFHAPVDAFRPNSFGLFCVSGNVYEWCRDWTHMKAGGPTELREGDGELLTRIGFARAYRGGGFNTPLEDMRLARRAEEHHWSTRQDRGVRPSRALDRPDTE